MFQSGSWFGPVKFSRKRTMRSRILERRFRWIVVLFCLVVSVHLVMEHWTSAAASRHQQQVVGSNPGERKLNMLMTTWASADYENLVNSTLTPESKPGHDQGQARSTAAAAGSPPPEKDVEHVGYSPEPDFQDSFQDKEWMFQREDEYRRRNWRLQEVCRRRQVVGTAPVLEDIPPAANQPLDFLEQVERPNVQHFSLATSFQTMGCFVNKVASSSLVSAFLLSNGLGPSFSSPHSLIGYLRPRTIEDFQFANRTFFKFTFVRHPMDRLLSCYRDKMLSSNHWSLPAFRQHVKETARRILDQRGPPTVNYQQRKLQSVPLKELNNLSPLNYVVLAVDQVNQGLARQPLSPQFNDLVQRIDARKRAQVQVPPDRQQFRSSRQEPQQPENVVEPGVVPTFEEFLEYILSTDLQGRGYDSHWVPYWRYCTPCHVPYHVIGKLETAEEDMKYVWQKTGLVTKVPIPWVNRQQRPAGEDEIERQFYAFLPRDLILRVYKRFLLDFEMYGYSINDILRRAGYRPIQEEHIP